MTMTRKQKKELMVLGITLAIYLLYLALFHFVPALAATKWLEPAAYLLLYLFIARSILMKAIRKLGSRDFMDENFLMSIASLGAFLLGEYLEAIAVVWFYQLGEWFQSYALAKSRKNIASLMEIRPDIVHVELDGRQQDLSPEQAKAGEKMIIFPGERVPLDGVVLEGSSSLDTSALTGESVPRAIRPGDELISGCINESGRLVARITTDYKQSTVSRILDLVENATNKKSRSEQFITRFARIYTPVVVFLALALCLIPSLITKDFNTWVYRALEFLVISCPCALVISVPLSFFAGIGSASRCGILFKGSNYLQMVSEIKVLVLDKTGTVTKGVFEVTNLQSAGVNGLDGQQLLDLAARAEAASTHPIAKSIIKASGLKNLPAPEVEEIAGKGLIANIDGKSVAVGNAALMKLEGIPEEQLAKTSDFVSAVYIALDKQYAGCIEISDVPKDNVKTILSLMKKDGVEKTVILSGDKTAVTKALADQVGVDEVHGDLLPDQKVACLEEIMKENKGKVVSFVGDGINDAPVLIRSDLGIAMGSLGSDAAIEAADVVLMNDQLDDLITAFALSRKTMRIVGFNIVFAILIKVLFLVLGALGLANMWMAVFADVGVSFLCILNALRLFHIQAYKADNPNRI